MRRKFKQVSWFTENGPLFKIEVSILKDIVTLTIDTSGAGLHKRGYRSGQGEAPLKETMAAALLCLQIGILISHSLIHFVVQEQFQLKQH